MCGSWGLILKIEFAGVDATADRADLVLGTDLLTFRLRDALIANGIAPEIDRLVEKLLDGG